MKSYTATELKNKTGQFIESVVKEHVAIYKSGREVAVVMPKDEYDKLMAMQDAFWAERAQHAEAKGFATEAEVAELLEAAKRA